MVNNGATVDKNTTLKPGIGVDHGTGQHHATGIQLS